MLKVRQFLKEIFTNPSSPFRLNLYHYVLLSMIAEGSVVRWIVSNSQFLRSTLFKYPLDTWIKYSSKTANWVTVEEKLSVKIVKRLFFSKCFLRSCLIKTLFLILNSWERLSWSPVLNKIEKKYKNCMLILFS